MRKFILLAILSLALTGAVDAGYLVIQSVSGGEVICPNVSIGSFNLSRCNIVLMTPYAKFFGLPTALYGLVAYLFFAILILHELNEKQTTYAMRLLVVLSSLGFFVSVYFVYLQFMVIKALCLYCLVSAALTTLIFIASIIYNMKYSNKGV